MWTLEDALIDLAQGDELTGSLRKIQLLDAGESLESIDVTSDWHRSGAETYSLYFKVSSSQRKQRQYVFKACVASPGAGSLTEVFGEWLRRRETVSALGISTPKLHAAGRADLVEEYIPWTLEEALASADDRLELLKALGMTVGCLVGAGFVPLSAHDWRSRGSDVVLIDFGQDLGPAGLAQGSEAGLLSEIIDRISKRFTFSGVEFQVISAAYEGKIRS